MATASKFNEKVHRFWTIVIYVFLLGALSTYFLPFVRVTVPVFGKKNWSVRQMVRTIPKGIRTGEQGEKKMTADFDFIDFVKEVAPKGEGTASERKQAANLVLGFLVPVAAVLAYLALVVGLFLALLKKSGAFIFSSGFTTVCASYVVLGILYFDGLARSAFSSALAKAEESPFFFIAERLVQQVSIGPDLGLIWLVALAAMIFLASLLRMSRSKQA